MMSEYLESPQLDEVREAALLAFGGDLAMRRFLFDGVNRTYESTLERFASPAHQIRSDLMAMNRVERLYDGSVPLQTWLRNAAGLALEAAPRAVFERALDRVTAAASGQPDVADAVHSAETQERAIFRDDTVEFGFLAAGAAAGRAVARILVTPYESGQPRLATLGGADPHAGTCWLAGRGLLLTNHHVLNARSAMTGRAPLASESDLVDQAAHAVVRFDFDTALDNGVELTGTDLLAWSADLDYAVLALRHDPGRDPLPLMQERLAAGLSDNVAVNVIQHPDGDPKRVGLRNNLVHETTDTDVRYFTDTKDGASGSPVLTDAWTVCALHRGSRKVSVEFQGKPSAYINVGTQMGAVLDDLKTRFPNVHAAVLAR
jgi:endonuclease G, mitochondrial